MKRTVFLGIALPFLVTAAALAATDSAPQGAALNKPPAGAKIVSAPSGLQYVDVVAGKGDTPLPGDVCIVHYTVWTEDGKEVGNSRTPRPVDPRDPSKGTKTLPFGFKLGSGQVIKGWDEGVAGMREGGTRLLFIPPQLGYGSKGAAGGAIPADAHLTFRVELLKVKREQVAPPEPAPTPAP